MSQLAVRFTQTHPPKGSRPMTSPTDPSSPFARELQVAINAARKAADIILEIYTAQSAEIYEKGDGSPVTDADLAADREIRAIIGEAFPNDALMTEEGESDAGRLTNDRVWIVDPIDGTAQYVARTGKFDVLIALTVQGEPVVAATIQPTTGLMHAAVNGQGAWRHHGNGWERHVLSPAEHPPRVVASKYYLEPPMQDALGAIAASLGAATPPIMEVGFQPRALDDSERWYDVFLGFPQDPRIFAAREWDIAASELVVREAGGVFTDAWGRRHRYNKRSTQISGGIIAAVSAELHAAMLKAIAPHLPAEMSPPDPADDR